MKRRRPDGKSGGEYQVPKLKLLRLSPKRQAHFGNHMEWRKDVLVAQTELGDGIQTESECEWCVIPSTD